VSIDWDAFYAHENRRRIPLPTYPFERQRFWVDPAAIVAAAQSLPARKLVSATRSTVERFVDPVASSARPRASVSGSSPTIPSSRQDRIASRVLRPARAGLRSGTLANQHFRHLHGAGFDSLSLTQVAFRHPQGIFRQGQPSAAYESMANVDMLAAHLDATVARRTSCHAPAISAPFPVTPHPSPSTAEVHQTSGATAARSKKLLPEQARTISRLISLLETGQSCGDGRLARPAEQSSAAAPSVPREVESTVPQRGINASSRLSERLSASYNESMTVRFTGNISIEKMARAIERLVDATMLSAPASMNRPRNEDRPSAKDSDAGNRSFHNRRPNTATGPPPQNDRR